MSCGSSSAAATTVPSALGDKLNQQRPQQGLRRNGKQWHSPRKAFRPGGGASSYEKRMEAQKAMTTMKAKEKEMKEEKEEERQRRVQAIKDKRAAKEERERYEKLAEKMHKKRVERLKRKEKRNKLLNS